MFEIKKIGETGMKTLQVIMIGFLVLLIIAISSIVGVMIAADKVDNTNKPVVETSQSGEKLTIYVKHMGDADHIHIQKGCNTDLARINKTDRDKSVSFDVEQADYKSLCIFYHNGKSINGEEELMEVVSVSDRLT